jgi:hypothetical protein
MKAIFLVHVVWVQLNLDGLPNHLVHVSHLSGQDGGILQLNAVAQVDAVFGHSRSVWLLLVPCLDGRDGLPDVDLITLAGVPAITSDISMYSALKSYFHSQEKCLMMLRKMFRDPVSLVWIYFLESHMKVCTICMKKIQSDSISGSEVATELDISSNKMKNRRDENVCTTKLISLLSEVEDVYRNVQFTQVTTSFYNTFLLYLEK